MSPSSSKISGASLRLARPWKEKEEKLTGLEVQFILENKAWACVLLAGKYLRVSPDNAPWSLWSRRGRGGEAQELTLA